VLEQPSNVSPVVRQVHAVQVARQAEEGVLVRRTRTPDLEAHHFGLRIMLAGTPPGLREVAPLALAGLPWKARAGSTAGGCGLRLFGQISC
jgi:hypothetical protein